MEGPTPVSALLHAATTATAGIYVITRLASPFRVPETDAIVCLAGCSTASPAASIGCVQFDIKRVIAYPTRSQLGLMLACTGHTGLAWSLLHLETHAIFKALPSPTAGPIIHAASGDQDMRCLKGLLKYLPLPEIVMSIGTPTIAGSPSLAGFHSKEGISDHLLSQRYNLSGSVSPCSVAIGTAYHS